MQPTCANDMYSTFPSGRDFVIPLGWLTSLYGKHPS